MVVGQEGQPEFYRGQPLPKSWSDTSSYFQRGFREGVDTVLGRRDGAQAGQGAARQDKSLEDELVLSAFEAVMEDRRADALAEVRKLSGRDRAVLSYWLQELSGVLDDAELLNRSSRYTRD